MRLKIMNKQSKNPKKDRFKNLLKGWMPLDIGYVYAPYIPDVCTFKEKEQLELFDDE